MHSIVYLQWLSACLAGAGWAHFEVQTTCHLPRQTPDSSPRWRQASRRQPLQQQRPQIDCTTPAERGLCFPETTVLRTALQPRFGAAPPAACAAADVRKPSP